MSASCHSHSHGHGHGHDHGAAAATSPAYRRILWIALAVNLAMFLVEIGAGVAAQSVSLLADSLDFWAMPATTGSASSCWAWRSGGAPAPRC